MKRIKDEMVKQKSKENKNQLSFREKQLVEFLVDVSIYIANKNSENQKKKVFLPSMAPILGIASRN